MKLVEKVKNFFGNDLSEKKLALWGLAFKPDTDDIREAPALYMIDELTKLGAKIVAFDPEAMENINSTIGDKIQYASNQYDALENADALLIATEWSVFRNPNFSKIQELLNDKIIFDGRNLYELDFMKENGFHYESIGRKTISK